MNQNFNNSSAMCIVQMGISALLKAVFNESDFDTCLGDMTRDGGSLQQAVDACSKAEKQRHPL